MLPSKTIPEVNRNAHARKLKAKAKTTMALPKKKATACSIEVEETEDDDSPHNITVRGALFNSSICSISPPKKVCSHLCYAQFRLNWGSRKQKTRKRVQFICFTRLLEMDQMAPRETMETCTIAVFMVLIRFVRLKSL